MPLSIYGNIADFRNGVDSQFGHGPVPDFVAAVSAPGAFTIGIKAGEILTLDNANITNVSSIASTREIFKVNGRGTNLIASLRRNAATTITVTPKIAVFARTLPTEIFRRVYTKAGTQNASLTSTSLDETDGTWKCTPIDYTNISWDLLGANEFAFGVEAVGAVSGGTLTSAVVEFRLF